MLLPKARVQAVELSHLSICTPCCVAGTGVAQVGVGKLIEAACAVEGGSAFVGEALVVDEAGYASRVDGHFVQAHGGKVTAFDPGSLGAYQCRTVFEVIRAIRGP